MDSTKSQSDKLNIKLLLVSAVILLIFFVVNVLRVTVAVKEMGKDETVEEEIVDESVPRQVKASDECLAKYKYNVYTSEDGNHQLVVDNLGFTMYCNKHLATSDIKEASYFGLYLCLVGHTDIHNFDYYKEDGKEYFVNEDKYLKLVYDETQGKWSTYTNSPSVIEYAETWEDDSGIYCSTGIQYSSLEAAYVDGWLPIFEYYDEENYNAVHEAYLLKEEQKEKEKVDKLKNVPVSLQAGGNTVTIHPVDGYLPYSKEELYIENTMLMAKADSYEDILKYNFDAAYSIRYSIKDTIEDKKEGYTHNKQFDIYRTTKQTIEIDSSGNEVIVLDGVMYRKKFTEGIDDSEVFINLCDYVLENDCSMQEACEALNVEYTEQWNAISSNIEKREYYKKLENGKYLCLTPENFEDYQDIYLQKILLEYEESDEYKELSRLYGTIGEDKIISAYLAGKTVPNDAFMRYLEDDCYTFE